MFGSRKNGMAVVGVMNMPAAAGYFLLIRDGHGFPVTGGALISDGNGFRVIGEGEEGIRVL